MYHIMVFQSTWTTYIITVPEDYISFNDTVAVCLYKYNLGCLHNYKNHLMMYYPEHMTMHVKLQMTVLNGKIIQILQKPLQKRVR